MRFIVIGGGCYGSFYARQLIRAADADAIPQPEIIVVDHNAAPRVSSEINDTRVRVVREDWDDFFDHYMTALRTDSDDQIVPPPFTPHLALRWLLRALPAANSRLHWSVQPFGSLPTTPFVHQSDNGTLNASHADWLCPVHCIEPEICPHTRDTRTWDMAETVRAFAHTLGGKRQDIDQIHLFQCLHRTHGVGTYPAAAVKTAFQELAAAKPLDKPLFAIVGTVSRCHGTMHLLKGEVGTDTVLGHDTSAPASQRGFRSKT